MSWRDEASGPYVLYTPTGEERCDTRREVWERLDGMIPEDRVRTTVFVGWRGDDGAYVHDLLSAAMAHE